MKKYGLGLFATLMIALILVAASNVSAETTFNDPSFAQTWNRVDKPVYDSSNVGRGQTWGPPVQSAAGVTSEPYNGGTRTVQYFDKARMELNSSITDQSNIFRVTTGLLVKELVTGVRQDGDNSFTQLLPSTVQIAGDPNQGTNNAVSPTYSSFKSVITFFGNERGKPSAPNSLINQKIDKDGNITTITPPEQRSIGGYDDVTQHNIADVFVNFANQSGLIWNGSANVQGPVFFGNSVYVLGRPVTDPYWVRAVVAGTEQNVMVQLFERRVLTYTPNNPAAFKVEMGNVGQHYYRWRYELSNPATTTPEPGTTTAPVTTTVVPTSTATIPAITTPVAASGPVGWSAITNPPLLVPCRGLANPQALIRQDGRVIIIGENLYNGSNCHGINGTDYGMYYTTDAENFQTYHLLARYNNQNDQSGGDPKVALDKDGSLWVLFSERLNSGPLVTYLKKVGANQLSGENPGSAVVQLPRPAGQETVSPTIGTSKLSSSGKVYLSWALYDGSNSQPYLFQVLEYNPAVSTDIQNGWKLCLASDSGNCSGSMTGGDQGGNNLGTRSSPSKCPVTFRPTMDLGVAPNDNAFVSYNWCDSSAGYISAIYHVASQSWQKASKLVSSATVVPKNVATADIFGNGYVFTNFPDNNNLGLYKLTANNAGAGWSNIAAGNPNFVYSNYAKGGVGAMDAIGTSDGSLILVTQSGWGQVQWLHGLNLTADPNGLTGANWYNGRIHTPDTGNGGLITIDWWNNKLGTVWLTENPAPWPNAQIIVALAGGGGSLSPSVSSK